nr:MAG TPA: holin [Caudoviricetes sp.]
MEKIDWKRKLTSRKFWTAIAGFVAMLVVAFGGTEDQATQITALIMAGAAVVAYIIGEGLADAAGANSADDAQPVEKPPEA